MNTEQVVAPVLRASTKSLLQKFVGVGLIIFVTGIIVDPERTWPSFLVALFYLLTLGLAGSFFIALQYISGARWGIGFRRIPEAMTGVLPWAGVMVVVLLALGGIHSLYEWSHPDVILNDVLLQEKSAWLNTRFFMLRMAIYFAVWILVSAGLVSNSRKQDHDASASRSSANVKLSAIFIILFAITFTAASFDLLMSLEPHWFSTIFALYNFSGMFLVGLAAITILIIVLRQMGVYRNVITIEHLHDMGKLMLSFSCFWAYLWFSQFMLIWYANIPEETVYYMHRHTSVWGSVSLLNLTVNWLVPFFVLLPRWTKRSEKCLLIISIMIMFGHWLDLFIMVQPAFYAQKPVFGLIEAGPTVGVIALFFLLFFKNIQKANMVPIHDPHLNDSLNHHV